MVQVVKKSGKSESFDAAKLEGSIKKAGGTASQAKQIAKSVQTLLENVTSAEIRRLVIAQLGSVNPSVARSYGSYRKSKRRS